MAAHRALVFLADRLDLALVDGDAGRTVAAGEIGHRKDMPVAADDRRQGLLEDRTLQVPGAIASRAWVPRNSLPSRTAASGSGASTAAA